MKTLLFCNGMLAVALIGLAVAYHMVDSQRIVALHRYETEYVCDNAVTTGKFNSCYATEEKYNTEYLCSQDQSNCWVEAK